MRMSDALERIDQAHKDAMQLWKREVGRATWPSKRHAMSYARFKVLRTVARGVFLTVDISEQANVNQTTTNELLLSMTMGGLIERAPFNNRMFRWEATPKGKQIAADLEAVHTAVNEQLQSRPLRDAMRTPAQDE
jgi:DNA-binding MarR family transcriptional regulator